MDVPAEILEELKCGECKSFLCRGPVYLEHGGAAACAQCFSPERPATRNVQYEAAANFLRFRFPCRNQEFGCRETVPFVDEGQVVAHEAVCEYRPYVCPVPGSSRCDWRGPSSQILQHCRAQHPGHEFVTCAGCGAVTVTLYRDEDDWLCERCAPARRACKNQAQGCTHQDFPNKCKKHEDYFCQQSTQCFICREHIPRGTLAAHYASAHRDVTHSAGATWRAIAGKRHCLVPCPAGTAMCLYSLTDTRFDLWVFIPVPSERLCEFRCEVRVTQPATGLTRTYTPDVSYEYYYSDWDITTNDFQFPDWNFEFDVWVNITNT